MIALSMDLTGRTPVYRGGALRCPQCGEAMRREVVPSAEVEVCDGCGGLWIDWFDGEIATLAASAVAARDARGGLFPRGRPDPPKSDSNCPRCLRALVPEHRRFDDARPGELVDGVDLLRCSECVGSFVPGPSAHLLFERIREPRPATLWEAVLALLRRLVERQTRGA